MVTASIKTDPNAPTLTEVPAPVDEMVTPEAADVTQDAESAPIRNVLPEAEPVLSIPVGEQGAPSTAPMQAEPAMAAPAETVMTDDPVVTPTMTDEVMDMVERLVAAPIQGSMQAPAAASGAIVLALDHARVMRVMGDVGTIVIGNPAIADVSMPDPGTMILTGKSYGETNLVMLDPAGEILAEQMLRVTIRGENTVSVFRGVQRTTLACAPTCEIRPTPGDAPEALQAGLSAFDQRNSAATNAANAR